MSTVLTEQERTILNRLLTSEQVTSGYLQIRYTYMHTPHNKRCARGIPTDLLLHPALRLQASDNPEAEPGVEFSRAN